MGKERRYSSDVVAALVWKLFYSESFAGEPGTLNFFRNLTKHHDVKEKCHNSFSCKWDVLIYSSGCTNMCTGTTRVWHDWTWRSYTSSFWIQSVVVWWKAKMAGGNFPENSEICLSEFRWSQGKSLMILRQMKIIGTQGCTLNISMCSDSGCSRSYAYLANLQKHELLVHKIKHANTKQAPPNDVDGVYNYHWGLLFAAAL